jgi:hypothetical protein
MNDDLSRSRSSSSSSSRRSLTSPELKLFVIWHIQFLAAEAQVHAACKADTAVGITGHTTAHCTPDLPRPAPVYHLLNVSKKIGTYWLTTGATTFLPTCCQAKFAHAKERGGDLVHINAEFLSKPYSF